MATVRRLAWRPAPLPDETLPSFIDRIAAAREIQLGAALTILGLRGQHGKAAVTTYGVDLLGADMKRFTSATGLSEERAFQMLVCSLPATVRVAEEPWNWKLLQSDE